MPKALEGWIVFVNKYNYPFSTNMSVFTALSKINRNVRVIFNVYGSIPVADVCLGIATKPTIMQTTKPHMFT